MSILKEYKKVTIITTYIIIILIIITVLNFRYNYYDKNIVNYHNDLSKIILEDDIDKLTYDYLYNDILFLESEINKKVIYTNNSYHELIKFYIKTNEIADKKLQELYDIYIYKLNDEGKQDFKKDYNDFFIAIKNDISEYELNNNKNDKNKLNKSYLFYKSLYEKKIKECYAIINKYMFIFN